MYEFLEVKDCEHYYFLVVTDDTLANEMSDLPSTSQFNMISLCYAQVMKYEENK